MDILFKVLGFIAIGSIITILAKSCTDEPTAQDWDNAKAWSDCIKNAKNTSDCKYFP